MSDKFKRVFDLSVGLDADFFVGKPASSSHYVSISSTIQALMLMYPLGRKRRTRRQQHWLLVWCVVPFTGCILLLDRNAHPVGISPVGVSVFNMNFERHFIFPSVHS